MSKIDKSYTGITIEELIGTLLEFPLDSTIRVLGYFNDEVEGKIPEVFTPLVQNSPTDNSVIIFPDYRDYLVIMMKQENK